MFNHLYLCKFGFESSEWYKLKPSTKNITLSKIKSYKIKNPGAQATRGHQDSRSQWDDIVKYILLNQIVKYIFFDFLNRKINLK